MIRNFKELVSQIKAEVPINELISEYVPVKKSGRGYVCLCPFHDDHKPSLQIHPQKGIFKCFSCGTGGDILTFYSLINKKKWADAVPELAVKYGLKVEYGEENKTEVEIKSRLFELNKIALEFFKENLSKKNYDSEIAYKYLIENRKLSSSTIEKFEIGYSLNEWDSLYNYFSKEKQYPQELIIASGLFIPRESDGQYYDRFRNRIIFPIINEKNNIIGFGGRTLTNEDAKYINSPETLIFNKGINLFGLNIAKDFIKEHGYAMITEGYLDVITAHQFGLANTVAVLGTALSKEQLRLLGKYGDFKTSKKIFLCLDSDLAGQRAAMKSFKVYEENPSDIELYVANLPAKDLDESLNNFSMDVVKESITSGKKILNFVIDSLISGYKSISDDSFKKESINEIVDIIKKISDPVVQGQIIKHASSKLNIDEELFLIKIKQFSPSKKYTTKKKQSDDSIYKMHITERFKHAELELLVLYISSFPDYIEMKHALSTIEFVDDRHKLVKDFLDNLSNTSHSCTEILDMLMFEFNEFKNMTSLISEIALKIEETDVIKKPHREKVIAEAKEWINWWIKNKQKMAQLTSKLKDSNSAEEGNSILLEMINLLKEGE